MKIPLQPLSKGSAPAAVPAIKGGYAASGRFVANNAGIVHEA